MASTKRQPTNAERPEIQNKAKLVISDSKQFEKKQRVVLNPADCNLDFDVQETGLQGQALHEQGFAYCWSGSRANVGIRGGKYCFSCKILSAQQVEMEDTPPDQQHVCRVGISRGDDAVGNLGETPHSFGYGATGKFSNAGKFSDYGEKFNVGDTIVCAVNLENKPLASVSFSRNGKWLGTAKEFDAGPRGLGVVDSPVREMQWECALFPHVLVKNVVVEVQFSVEDGLIPEEGYKPWACAIEDGNAVEGPVFSDSKGCEVLMMVGLPASGKTTWAEKWVKKHPEKRYILLGTNLALDQMKVPGLLRKHNYGERFDRLMDRATGIFNTLLARAAKMPRNFIIDQTNVYKSARKRKLKPFYLYHKIGVVIFPKPDDLKSRAAKRFREMGKEVPAEAVNEMIANFILPTSKDMPGSDEFFDEVLFPELNQAEAQRHLEEMKLELRSASSSNVKSSISPYSRETSIQSTAHCLPPNQGAMPVARGLWNSHSSLHAPPYNGPGSQQNSHSSLHAPPYNGPGSQQVSPTYSGARLTRTPDFVSGESHSGPGSSQYPNYQGHDSYQRPDFKINHAIPGGATQPYQSYGVDSYGRTNFESMSPLSAGSMNPYQRHGNASPFGMPDYGSKPFTHQGGTEPDWSYGRVDTYSGPNFDHSSPIGSNNFGSSRTPLSSNSTHPTGRHPIDSQFDLHSPLPTYYNQPYRTPPPRLPYEPGPPRIPPGGYRAGAIEDFERMPPPGPRPRYY